MKRLSKLDRMLYAARQAVLGRRAKGLPCTSALAALHRLETRLLEEMEPRALDLANDPAERWR